jgi:hypothetical protein
MKKPRLFSLVILIAIGLISLPFGWSGLIKHQTIKGDLLLACGNAGNRGQLQMGMSTYEPTRIVIKEVIKEKEDIANTKTNMDDQSLLVSTTKLVGNIVLFPFKLVSTILDLIF